MAKMNEIETNRNKMFLIAAALAGTTMSNFAKSIGVSRTLVSLVLSGKRKSNKVWVACNDFIKKEYLKININHNVPVCVPCREYQLGYIDHVFHADERGGIICREDKINITLGTGLINGRSITPNINEIISAISSVLLSFNSKLNVPCELNIDSSGNPLKKIVIDIKREAA
jgi:hypothetical protein